MRLPPLIGLALLLGLLPAEAKTGPLAWPVWRTGMGSRPVPAYRGDRVSLQLRPFAARAVQARSLAFPAKAVGLVDLDRALGSLGATLQPEFRGETPPPLGSGLPDFTAFFLVHLPPDAELETSLSRLASLPEVSRVSPIGIAPAALVPNDSLWSSAWCYYQPSRRDVHAPEAWDITRGDSSIVVALIDTGLIPYHPDIGGVIPGRRGNIWTNAPEAAGTPGLDDDGNGFVDDAWGWDFVALDDTTGVTEGEDWQDEDADPNDFVGHGTGVAGLIGALSDNGIGITGMAWDVRIMPLRVGWSMRDQQTGVVDMTYIAQAVRYATRMGAQVINLSLATQELLELDEAVDAAIAAGVTVVVAAGNNGSPHALAARPGLVYVAATDANDVLPPWTNVGPYVDLTAPGAAVPTTTLTRTGTDSLGLRQPSYVPDANGTSFAAPLVSGAVALLQANRRRLGSPPLAPEQVRRVLMDSADDISSQNPTVPAGFYGAGRLNVAGTLTRTSPLVQVSRWIQTSPNPGRPPIALSWGAPTLGGGSRSLAIHDLSGRRVRTFELGPEPSGVIAWDGTDRHGRRLAAGLYFASLSGEGGRVVTRLVLLP